VPEKAPGLTIDIYCVACHAKESPNMLDHCTIRDPGSRDAFVVLNGRPLGLGIIAKAGDNGYVVLNVVHYPREFQISLCIFWGKVEIFETGEEAKAKYEHAEFLEPRAYLHDIRRKQNEFVQAHPEDTPENRLALQALSADVVSPMEGVVGLQPPDPKVFESEAWRAKCQVLGYLKDSGISEATFEHVRTLVVYDHQRQAIAAAIAAEEKAQTDAA
jgi:hypothetical protein